MKAFRKRVGAALLFGSMVFTTANNVGVWAANDGKSEVLAIEEMGADQGGDNKENKSNSSEVYDNGSQVSDNLKKPLVAGGMGALAGTVLGIGATLAGKKVLNSENSTKNGGEKKEIDGADISVEQLNKDLRDSRDELDATKKSFTDYKSATDSSVNLFDVFFGAWGLLHKKGDISVPRIVVAVVLHVIFAAAGIFQLVRVFGYGSGDWQGLVCGAAKVLGGPVFVVFDVIRSLFGSCMDVGFNDQ